MFEARIKIELDFIYYCKYLEKKTRQGVPCFFARRQGSRAAVN